MQTIDEAAAALGVSPSTVRAWCELAGLPARRGARGRRTLTAGDMAQLEAVARMRQSGQDMDVIRAALGVATESPQRVTTVFPLVPSVDSPSPYSLIDRLAGTLEAAIGEGERWGAVLARLDSLETELAVTRDRLARLEEQHAQTAGRVTAQEARRPRFGWVALSVAVAATAGALLGRPVPVQAAPSLANKVRDLILDVGIIEANHKRDLDELNNDIRLLKVAANTLACHTRSLRSTAGTIPATWDPFPGFGTDRRPVVWSLSNEKETMAVWAQFPALRPATITSDDLCEFCKGVLPRP